jgi:predicted RNase H-like nuclease (RuvC/YqgF family)
MANTLSGLMKAVQSTPANKPQMTEKPKEPAKESAEHISEFIEKLNNLTRAIRTIEERYNNLRRRTQLTDHNILVQHQRLNKELHLNDSDLIDIKRDLQKINDKVNMLEKEIELCGKKQDLDILAKYIGYWKPLDFLTKNQAEKIISEALLAKKQAEMPPEKPAPKHRDAGERSIY